MKKLAWEVKENDCVKVNGEYKLAKEFLYTPLIEKTCSIALCNGTAHSRGMCKPHYQKQYRQEALLPPKKLYHIRETTSVLFHDGTTYAWQSNDEVETVEMV